MRGPSSEASGSSHQQNPRRAQQRPADGDPLLLASGQPRRPPVEKVADAQDLHDVAPLGGPGAAVPRRKPAAEREVLAHREMGKQAGLLEHVTDATAVRRQGDPAAGVEEYRVAGRNPPLVRPQQAGDGVDHRCLAGAGTPEQRSDPVRCREGGIQLEAAETMAERNVEAHLSAILRAMRRETNSEAKSAAIAIATETITSRSADDSPPGTWRKV